MLHDTTDDKVWGVAYHIIPSKIDEVRSYLDLRENNGYTIHTTPFFPTKNGETPIATLVYIGTPDNPQFTGPQDPQLLAEHVWKSRGASGENKDYLFRLENSLDELCKDSTDQHVYDLAAREPYKFQPEPSPQYQNRTTRKPTSKMCRRVLKRYTCNHVRTQIIVCDEIAMDAIQEAQKLGGRTLPETDHDVIDEVYSMHGKCQMCREAEKA
ncbi:MAG: hypothetical protein M1816_006454 [Peltula sp. TS41687]|nr:MAG: hypothetical protein M1816_006454 [Peltula sp. TS41687]